MSDAAEPPTDEAVPRPPTPEAAGPKLVVDLTTGPYEGWTRKVNKADPTKTYLKGPNGEKVWERKAIKQGAPTVPAEAPPAEAAPLPPTEVASAPEPASGEAAAPSEEPPTPTVPAEPPAAAEVEVSDPSPPPAAPEEAPPPPPVESAAEPLPAAAPAEPPASAEVEVSDPSPLPAAPEEAPPLPPTEPAAEPLPATESAAEPPLAPIEEADPPPPEADPPEADPPSAPPPPPEASPPPPAPPPSAPPPPAPSPPKLDLTAATLPLRTPKGVGGPTRGVLEIEITLSRPTANTKLGVRFFDLYDNFYDPHEWVLADVTTEAIDVGARGPTLTRTNARPVVRAVTPGGLADEAGVKANDIVVSANGSAEITILDMGKMLRDDSTGDIHLIVKRRQPRAQRGGGVSAGPSAMGASGGVLGATAPPPPDIEQPSGIPVTARAVKSSIQLDKELRDVGRTLEKMTKRCSQTLMVVRGVRKELLATQKSVRARLESNPSLTSDPRGKEAQAAAEAAVSDIAVAESLTERFGYEPTESMLTTELRVEKSKMIRRAQTLNKPVVEALVELEETATLGAGLLERHDVKVQAYLEQLWEVYASLRGHYEAHHTVASPKADRARVHRLHDHATHEALEIAAQREDSARNAANQALKCAQQEKSTLEAYKADVQRAMLARTQKQMAYKRMDNQGCTFKPYTSEERKLGES